MSDYTIRFIKTTPLAITPTRGSDRAAGFDLYSAVAENQYILPGKSCMIDTGIAMALPNYHFGAIYPRSGLACKQGLRLQNSVAVIDEDFRGTVKVCLYNDSDDVRVVKYGDRIAQLVVQPYEAPDWIEVDNLDATKRGDGGFGSTGK